MSELKIQSTDQEQNENELLNRLFLDRKEGEADVTEDLGSDGHLSFRPKVKVELTNANMHYGGQAEEETVGSQSVEQQDTSVASQTLHRPMASSAKVANGVVFLEGQRADYFVIDKGDGKFVFRDIAGAREIAVSNVENVHFGDFMVKPEPPDLDVFLQTGHPDKGFIEHITDPAVEKKIASLVKRAVR